MSSKNYDTRKISLKIKKLKSSDSQNIYSLKIVEAHITRKGRKFNFKKRTIKDLGIYIKNLRNVGSAQAANSDGQKGLLRTELDNRMQFWIGLYQKLKILDLDEETLLKTVDKVSAISPRPDDNDLQQWKKDQWDYSASIGHKYKKDYQNRIEKISNLYTEMRNYFL